MLVKINEVKGKPIWINPVHVKGVRPWKQGAMLYIAINSNFGEQSIKTTDPVEEVVKLLNAGMPDWLSLMPLEDDGRAGGAAAAAAV